MPPAHGALRLVAGVSGIVMLLIGSLFSAGAALGSAVGIWIAAIIARNRGRPLTRGPAWLAAFAAAGVYAIVGFAVLWRLVPDGTMSRAMAAADSAAATQPPPAWLQRAQPGATRAPAEPTAATRALTVWAGAVGGIMGIGIIAGFIASGAWCAAMLLTLAFTGRWISRAAPPMPAALPEDAIRAP